MNGQILDPGGAQERLAAWKGRIDRLAADTQAMSTQLQAVRVTATDPAGLVEVTIDSTGALVDVKFTDRIQRTAPAEVSRAVMATLAQARNQLADRSKEIIAGTVGTDSVAARAIAESVDRQFRTAAPEPQRPRPVQNDDEGYEGRTYTQGQGW